MAEILLHPAMSCEQLFAWRVVHEADLDVKMLRNRRGGCTPRIVARPFGFCYGPPPWLDVLPPRTS